VQRATDAIEAAGGEYYETVNEKTGSIVHRVHPAVAVRAAADKRFAKYAEQFGLTPASRLRAAATPPEVMPADDSWLTI
jgi:phage terminase small subunit